MKLVRRFRGATRPTFLDARFHGHDVIPAQAGIQEGARILDMHLTLAPVISRSVKKSDED